MLNLEADFSQVRAEISQIAGRMSDLSPVFARIGAMEDENIRDRIGTTKVSPEGDAWAPWSERRQEEREAKQNTDLGLLWDTGELLKSIRFDVSPERLAIGTDVPYAKDLQEGIGMPARPFAGWTSDGLVEYADMVAAYIMGAK